MKKQILLLLLLTCLACEHEPAKTYLFSESANKGDEYSLTKISSIKFEIDTTLGVTNQSISVFENDESEYVSIFNGFDGSIHYFDYGTGEQVRKQLFDRDGPDGIGTISNMGHYIHNEDSILIFNHWEQTVSIFDSNSRLVNKISMANIDRMATNMILVSSSLSPFLNGHLLYVPFESSGDRYSEMDNFAIVNLLSEKVTTALGPNPFLDTAFYGPLTPYSKSVDYNREAERLVVSSAKDPHLRLYDLNDLSFIESHETPSKFLDKFESFPKKSSEPPFYGYGYKELASQTNMKGLFTSVIHDPFREVYYRFFLLPRTEEQYQKRAKGMQFSVVILDNNFEKIGETLLPEGVYGLNLHFLNKEGLHLVNLEEYAKDEDHIVFDVYNPVNNEN